MKPASTHETSFKFFSFKVVVGQISFSISSPRKTSKGPSLLLLLLLLLFFAGRGRGGAVEEGSGFT